MSRTSFAALAFMVLVAACGGGRNQATGDIEATRRASIVGPGECGVRNPLEVRAVAGVRLSRPAIMTAETAQALESWVSETAIPAFRGEGGGLQELTVAAHYACRTRNNRSGARLSEHALGRAIDISGFVLRDGTRVSVLDGWRSRGDARALRRVHRGACGPFGTVLGPDADRFHQDHFHFDVARYRNGNFCR